MGEGQRDILQHVFDVLLQGQHGQRRSDALARPEDLVRAPEHRRQPVVLLCLHRLLLEQLVDRHVHQGLPFRLRAADAGVEDARRCWQAWEPVGFRVDRQHGYHRHSSEICRVDLGVRLLGGFLQVFQVRVEHSHCVHFHQQVHCLWRVHSNGDWRGQLHRDGTSQRQHAFLLARVLLRSLPDALLPGAEPVDVVLGVSLHHL
mmetsp:Transcript_60766/g.198975  ORF Transcript_60766/g.198975 Transcript_60766/m.198975 type:complete len:203 (+) Transcript_60766:5655-6263(+)